MSWDAFGAGFGDFILTTVSGPTESVAGNPGLTLICHHPFGFPDTERNMAGGVDASAGFDIASLADSLASFEFVQILITGSGAISGSNVAAGVSADDACDSPPGSNDTLESLSVTTTDGPLELRHTETGELIPDRIADLDGQTDMGAYGAFVMRPGTYPPLTWDGQVTGNDANDTVWTPDEAVDLASLIWHVTGSGFAYGYDMHLIIWGLSPLSVTSPVAMVL